MLGDAACFEAKSLHAGTGTRDLTSVDIFVETKRHGIFGRSLSYPQANRRSTSRLFFHLDFDAVVDVIVAATIR